MSAAGSGDALVVRPLLADASLEIVARGDVWPRVAPWVPRVPEAPGAPRARARITARTGVREFDRPDAPPVIQLRSVSGWAAGGRILLDSREAGLSAVVDPDALAAAVRLGERANPGETERTEVFAILTLAAAFLLGRIGRTLVHAAAVVGPDDRAWLLVGGTFSGKTTTCINLIRQGWDYLSDDHVVIGGVTGGTWLEGWPRRFNLDDGYDSGVSTGTRRRVDPDRFGPGGWRRRALLGGLLFPRVVPDRPTELLGTSGRTALQRLLPLSPWLLGDPGTAPAILGLLTTAVRLPAYELRLGADSYRDGAPVAELLSRACTGTGVLDHGSGRT